MKTAHVAAFVLALAPLGCDRVHSMFGHDDAGSTSASTDPGTPSGKEIPALVGFEGEIDLQAKAPSKPDPIAFAMLVKGDAVRLDAPPELLNVREARTFTGGGKVYAILKTGEKKAYVVLDAKRQAIVLDLDTIGDKMKSMHMSGPGGDTTPAAPKDPPKVTKTGKMETVAGFTCEDWDIVNADKSKATACVADKGSFFHLPITGIPTEQAWALELMDGKHFPLKGVAYGTDGTEKGRVEVTKLDKRTLDAAQFEVPQGYAQISLEQMLGALGGGGDSPVPTSPVPTPDVPPHGQHGHGKHHGKRQQ